MNERSAGQVKLPDFSCFRLDWRLEWMHSVVIKPTFQSSSTVYAWRVNLTIGGRHRKSQTSRLLRQDLGYIPRLEGHLNNALESISGICTQPRSVWGSRHPSSPQNHLNEVFLGFYHGGCCDPRIAPGPIPAPLGTFCAPTSLLRTISTTICSSQLVVGPPLTAIESRYQYFS